MSRILTKLVPAAERLRQFVRDQVLINQHQKKSHEALIERVDNLQMTLSAGQEKIQPTAFAEAGDFEILRRIVLQSLAVDLVEIGPFLNLMYTDDVAYRSLPDECKNKTLRHQEQHNIDVDNIDAETYINSWGTQSGDDIFKLLLASFHFHGLAPNFIDVGAHYGSFSMEMARFARSINMQMRGHAFECGITKDLVEYNIYNNGFSNDIKLHKHAIGAVNKYVLLHRDLAQSEGNRIGDAFKSWSRGTVSVPVYCSTLDSFAAANSISGPAIVKVDTEGAEPAVLRGAQGLLASGPSALMCEFTPGAAGPNMGVASPYEYLSKLIHEYSVFEIGTHHDSLVEIDLDNSEGLINKVLASPAGWTDILALDRRSEVCRSIAEHLRRCASRSVFSRTAG